MPLVVKLPSSTLKNSVTVTAVPTAVSELDVSPTYLNPLENTSIAPCLPEKFPYVERYPVPPLFPSSPYPISKLPLEYCELITPSTFEPL